MKEIYTNFAMDMTMIFVNKKDTAKALQEQLKSLNISAEILIGGDHMDKAQRD
jgi:superfamily II DNA/RNA helicase